MPENFVKTDLDEIRRAIAALHPDLGKTKGYVVELRALEVPSGRSWADTWYGFFDSPDLLEKAAFRLGEKLEAPGVYITLNPVDPGLLSVCRNRIETAGRKNKSAKDKNTTKRRWFLIDLDPARVPGISSTDKELETASNCGHQILLFLNELGWPDPMRGLSGNGIHLLYRIDLPCDDPSKALVNGCLKALADKFGGNGVDVDTTVGSPAQISKVYGTVARKGDPDSERPHRQARLTHAAHGGVVPLEQLEQLAAMAPEEKKPGKADAARTSGNSAATEGGDDEWIVSWIARRGVEIRGDRLTGAGRVWDLTCPFCGDNGGAAVLGKLSAGGVYFNCFHKSCEGKHWDQFREHYDPAASRKKTKAVTDKGKEHGYGEGGKSGGDKESVAETLFKLAKSRATFFHDDERQPWAHVKVNAHREVWRVGITSLQPWLAGIYWTSEKKAANQAAIGSAINLMKNSALFELHAEQRDVHVRVAHLDDVVYLDLGGPAWRVVEIKPAGWQILDESPIMFYRPKGLLQIPDPAPGGSLEQLREFINVPDDEAWILVCGWLIGCLGPGPYVILQVGGEQGSAKTSLCDLLRKIIDPNKVSLRAPPINDRDLAICACNNWVVAHNNLSNIPAWLSDGLCRVAEVSGFATRALYTDREEMLVTFKRPILINGITLTGRPDLMDRSSLISLPMIPVGERRDETLLMAAFEKARPKILGGILDAAVHALANPYSVKIDELPRMADAARWVCDALGSASYADVVGTYQADAELEALEGDPVGAAVIALMHERREAGKYSWSGTAGDLLNELSDASEDRKPPQGWPKSARKLTNDLKRLAPVLRRAGVEWSVGRKSGTRTHTLKWTDGEEEQE